jgi:hypothetical protein
MLWPMVLLDVMMRKPNYQFRCPRCGHAITVLWAEPPERERPGYTLCLGVFQGGRRLRRSSYAPGFVRMPDPLIQLNRRMCRG